MPDTPEQPAFSYDRVAYPSPVLETLNPDRLRASALLHGLNPPDATGASILEIGCGDGISLAAWASIAPGAKAVGFDLSAAAIAKGRELIEAAGLTTVDLHVGDIVTYPRDGEKFDYIVCHGVLSWVPDPVRAALIELISARLAPGGIAYVSFDCLPGAAVKAAIVPFLREQVKTRDDPAAAMLEAARVIAMLNRSLTPASRNREQVNLLMDTLVKGDAGYFYHDWLAEYYAPVDLGQLISAAAAQNLKLAGSAANYDLLYADLDAEAQQVLESYGDDHGPRLQLIDLLRGPYTFHRDLLVRTDAPPPRIEEGHRFLSYCFDGSREEIEDEEGPAIRYFYNKTAAIRTNNPAARAVLDLLHGSQPAEPTYAQILAATGLDELVLRNILFDICRSNFTAARSMPAPFVLEPGERPTAGLLARTMAKMGERVVNLRCSEVEIEQDETRLLLVLSDGTRTRAEIARDMSILTEREIPLAMVEGAVAHFARRRLFSA